MTYNADFKTRVFEVFRYRKDFRKIVKAIEADLHTQVRYFIENAYDNPDFYYTGDNGFRYVKEDLTESEKDTYFKTRDLYTEFMDMYDRYLDKLERSKHNEYKV